MLRLLVIDPELQHQPLKILKPRQLVEQLKRLKRQLARPPELQSGRPNVASLHHRAEDTMTMDNEHGRGVKSWTDIGVDEPMGALGQEV